MIDKRERSVLPDSRIRSGIPLRAAAILMTVFACSAPDRGAGSGNMVIADTLRRPEMTLPLASEPDVFLVFPVAATVLSDGRIVVADGTAPGVLYFDSDGRHVRTVGRKGEGPGEFRWIYAMTRCAADTLVTWDFGLGRLTLLDPAGEVVQTVGPAGLSDRILDVKCSVNGMATLMSPDLQAQIASPDVEPTTITAPLLVTDKRANNIRTLDTVAVTQVQGRGLLLLGPLTTIATLDSATIIVGTAESSAVDLYPIGGGPARPVTLDIERRPPNRTHIEKAAAARVIWFEEAALRERFYEMELEGPVADTLPPYSAVFGGDNGAIWIQLTHPGDSVTRLREITRDGNPMGEIVIPIDSRTLDVGPDYVLVAHEDEIGQPRVSLYALR